MSVASFDGLDQSLCHVVALQTVWWRRANLKSCSSCESHRFSCNIARPIVGEPLDATGDLCCVGTESILDALSEKISDHPPVDTSRRCHPADDFSVTTVQGESNLHLVTVAALKTEAIGAPSHITSESDDLPFMGSCRARLGSLQQQPVLSHNSIDSLVIHKRALFPQDCGHSTVSISRAIHQDCLDCIKAGSRLRLRRRRLLNLM